MDDLNAFYVAGNLCSFAACLLFAAVLMMSGRSVNMVLLLSKEDAQVSKRVYGAFVLATGLGHALDGARGLLGPVYSVLALWHVLTAVTSLIAAGWTWKLQLKRLTR